MASLKQYPSGYYTVRYRKDGEDCYEPTWTKDKIKAKRFKRQFLSNLAENLSLVEKRKESNRVKLRDAIELYKSDVNVNDKTMMLIHYSLNHLVEAAGNDAFVDTIDFKDRIKLKKMLNKSYAKTTVNLRLRQIKTFFRWMVNEAKYLDSMPFTLGKGQMEKVDDKSYKAFTKKDLVELYSFVHDPIILSYFRFAEKTGYRLSEINKAFINDKGEIQAKGKGGKFRKFPFLDELTDDWYIIKASNYRDERVSKACTMAWRKVLISRQTDHGDIQDMGKEKLLKLVRPILHKEYIKVNGLKTDKLNEQQKAEAMAMAKTFHSFRHTWCENLYNQIGDIYGVSKAIGHSSVTVTQKYEHTGGMKVLEKAYKEKSVAQS
jgi:integrase